MQSLLICLVALLNLALGAFSTNNNGISDGKAVRNGPSSIAGGFGTTLASLTTSLAARDDATINSAQAGCWAKADGDMKLVLSDRILAMTTYIPADDFPYDLSIEGAELFCANPPDGKCEHCWRNTTTVEVKYATENSWCYFLFTSEYAGTGYESFYVHWYQGVIDLHNAGFVKIVMCHDEDESKRKREISIAQPGCGPNSEDIHLELGMDLDTTDAFVPASGKNYRLSQPHPELQCSKSGHCKHCDDQVNHVYIRDGPASAHCDLLFSESAVGGYTFSVSISQQQDIVKLPQPGVLTMAICYSEDQQVDNWISKLQNPLLTSEAAATPGRKDIEQRREAYSGSIDSDHIPILETHGLSVRDDSAGCDIPSDDNYVHMYFGTDGNNGGSGYNFSTSVPTDYVPRILGQPNPQLHCRRVIGDKTKCGDCWSPLLWIYFDRIKNFGSCTITVSDDLNGGGMLDIYIDSSPMVYKLQKEMNLLLVTCTPEKSTSVKGSAKIQAKSSDHDVAVRSAALVPRDDSDCFTTDSEHTKFTIHAGTGIWSSFNIKNDGQWYIIGETKDATVFCSYGTSAFFYCENCKYKIDSLEQYGAPGVECQLEFSPLPDNDDKFNSVRWTLVGSAIVNTMIPQGYYGRVKCDGHTVQMGREVSLPARSTSDEHPLHTTVVSGSHQGLPSFGLLAPLALLPLALV